MQALTDEPLTNLPTIEQWFSNPFVQILSTSDNLGWNHVYARSTKLAASPEFIPTPATDTETIVLVMDGASHIECSIVEHAFSKWVRAGDMMIYPCISEMLNGRWFSPVEVLFIELPHQTTIDIASTSIKGDPEQIEFRLQIGFRDSFLQQLASELYRELENQSYLSPLFADSVANTMILHLLRKYSNVSSVQSICGGKLTASQVRMIDEYIQAHLHERISLADLAACLHVSVPHFEKMFRATFHQPPYRYVLECRVEKAKGLLHSSKQSLYDVARDCGFANQSHFTRHFTKMVGISPARFVRGARN